jgi:hypothetical protein
MSYPYLIQGNNIVVVIGNQPHTISKTHITYNKVLDAIKQGDWETVKDVIEPKKVVLNYGQGNVSVQGETLYWKGKELNTGLASRMIAMLQEGFPIEPMVNFMDNLYKNPSHRAVTELYGFLEKNNLPITPDGHFLAYKKVRANYLDVHSGTMDNSPGRVVEMERHDVDDNKDNTCSKGLHFCAQSYLSSFGGDRTVIVKINPADVVSIPSDYNDAKGRACRYEVIGEVGVNPDDEVEFTQPVQSNANSNTYVAPNVSGPKLGSTEFYRGYSAGFDGLEYDWDDSDSNYDEGYDKGSSDAVRQISERYRYVEPNKPNDTWSDGWPIPKGF